MKNGGYGYFFSDIPWKRLRRNKTSLERTYVKRRVGTTDNSNPIDPRFMAYRFEI